MKNNIFDRQGWFFYSQLDAMDCGPTCLRMVAKHYGVGLSAQGLREAAEIGKDGVNLLGIAQAAEHYGFRTLGVKVSLSKLKEDAPLPCIVHWRQNHFVVVYKISKSKVWVADPARGLFQYMVAEFESQWATTLTDGVATGVALLLEPTPALYEQESMGPSSNESYSNITEDSLLKIAVLPVFQNLWGITKDQIDVCKDCEFRLMCQDRRIYIQDNKNIHSKPLKCSYSPYETIWH